MTRRAASAAADRPVRHLRTFGGWVAHADPAADYLPALICAGAGVEISGPDGYRAIAIESLIVDWYETMLGHGEIITGITLPARKPFPPVYRKLARAAAA